MLFTFQPPHEGLGHTNFRMKTLHVLSTILLQMLCLFHSSFHLAAFNFFLDPHPMMISHFKKKSWTKHNSFAKGNPWTWTDVITSSAIPLSQSILDILHLEQISHLSASEKHNQCLAFGLRARLIQRSQNRGLIKVPGWFPLLSRDARFLMRCTGELLIWCPVWPTW